MPQPIEKPIGSLTTTPSPMMEKNKRNDAEDSKGLKQACNEFESLFIQHMLQQMRKTVPKNGLFNGGNAEDIYTSMLDGEMARRMSRNGGIGLSSVVYGRLAGLAGKKK
jgi:flagellar protein FlgJ